MAHVVIVGGGFGGLAVAKRLARQRGLAVMAIFGNVVTAWSWFGVNMLGVGLHSYGFTDSGFMWLMMFIVSQLLVILVGVIPLRYWASFSAPAAPTPMPPSGKAKPSMA